MSALLQDQEFVYACCYWHSLWMSFDFGYVSVIKITTIIVIIVFVHCNLCLMAEFRLLAVQTYHPLAIIKFSLILTLENGLGSIFTIKEVQKTALKALLGGFGKGLR